MNASIEINRNSLADLKKKTLLVLTPSYPNVDESFIAETFVKYQVAELKQYFQKLIVIALALG
jgi:teichuronic acid biosynthesis glycosyltransferase TuaC